MMTRIRITKQFSFEMGHFLFNHEGKCKNFHGHSYKLEVSVIGRPLCAPGHPGDGMVMDFSDLKLIIKENVIDVLDHRFLVNSKSLTDEDLKVISNLNSGIILMPVQPTTENLILFILERLLQALPSHVELCSVRLHETDSSFCEWFRIDNA